MDHVKCAGSGKWAKIYIALVLFLNLAVIFLVVSGEKRRIFWLGIAVLALASFLLAKLKVRRHC